MHEILWGSTLSMIYNFSSQVFEKYSPYCYICSQGIGKSHVYRISNRVRRLVWVETLQLSFGTLAFYIFRHHSGDSAHLLQSQHLYHLQSSQPPSFLLLIGEKLKENKLRINALFWFTLPTAAIDILMPWES